MGSLFVDELDGLTFETEDEACAYGEYLREGPVWSNFGGWVA
jgi:hypothetical protein